MKIHACRTAVAALAAMLSLSANASAQSFLVNVPSAPLWKDTGVSVTNGQVININANGLWSWADWAGVVAPPDGELTPGSYNLFLGNEIHSTLIAYIGSDPYQGVWPSTNNFPTNGYWQVGSAVQFISNTNGELWLGINDDAEDGAVGDNAGSVNALVFFGYGATNDYSFPRPEMSVSSITSNTLVLAISGQTNSNWAVYDSSDLLNWSVLGIAQLDDNGQGTFTNFTGVDYRFYMLHNGLRRSRVFGFVRKKVPAGGYALISDQLEATNTLDGLFKTMPDGQYLPDGTIVSKWNGSAYDTYTWSSGSWSPNGNATLNPGEGVFFSGNTNGDYYVTFAGLVPEGELTMAIPVGSYIYSVMLPMGGGINSVLNYVPHNSDRVQRYLNGNWQAYTYSGLLQKWTPREPVFDVGEAFYLIVSTTNSWQIDYLPKLSEQ